MGDMDIETLVGEHAALRRAFFLLLDHVATDNPAFAASMRDSILAYKSVSSQFILDNFGRRSRKATQGFEAVLDEAFATLEEAID